MAPSSFKKKPGRRPREKQTEPISDVVPVKKKRVEHDVVEGLDIFSFENELEMEFFTNIEEPLPRKIHDFHGFDEDNYEAADLNLLKRSFDRFVKNCDVLRENRSDRVEVPKCEAASSTALKVADNLIELDDEESTSALEQTALTHVDTPNAVVVDSKPIAEVINIDSDSDDDVVIVSDPNAPIPQPVRDCVCPNCGKVKRIDQSRRVADSGKESARKVSIASDEVVIIPDESVPLVNVDQNKTTPLQPKIFPARKLHAKSADIQKVPVQPAKILTDVSLDAAEVLPDQQPSSTEGQNSSPSSQLSAAVHRPPHTSTNISPCTINMTNIQKPSDQLKQPAAVPQTVCVVYKESGKSFLLKINGAKSKILRSSTSPSKISTNLPQSFNGPLPGEKLSADGSGEADTLKPPPVSVVAPKVVEVLNAQKPSLIRKSVDGPELPGFRKIEQPNRAARTCHVTIPPNTIRVTLPPGFSDKNTFIRAQSIDGAKQQVHVGNPKARRVDGFPGSFPQPGLIIVPPRSQVKQQAKTISSDNELKLACSKDTKIRSALLESAMALNAEIESPTEESFEPVVLEDDTKSVVKDMINFVCRQENFPTSFPYSEERTEQFCSDVPCKQLRCRMGCMCVSLSKKNVRRVRCKNADCIFGCICVSHSVVPVSRHAKTMPNVKVLGISRRKQVLTVLPDCDVDFTGVGTQPALKSFLPVQKVAVVGRRVSLSHRSNPDVGMTESDSTSNGLPTRNVTGTVRSSFSQGSTPMSPAPVIQSVRQGSRLGSSTQLPSKGLPLALKVPAPKSSGVRTPRSHPISEVAPAKESLALPDISKRSAPSQDPAPRLPVPVVQPRSFFGREKTPIPDRALMCLTPGFGYVPLSAIHPTVTLDSPFKPGSSKSFLGVRQATEWLNSKLETYLNTKIPPNLRWVVADGQTIEKKQQHRLSVDLLNSPNCTISRNGAVYSS